MKSQLLTGCLGVILGVIIGVVISVDEPAEYSVSGNGNKFIRSAPEIGLFVDKYLEILSLLDEDEIDLMQYLETELVKEGEKAASIYGALSPSERSSSQVGRSIDSINNFFANRSAQNIEVEPSKHQDPKP